VKRRLALAIRTWKAALTRTLLGRHAYAVIARTDFGLFAVDPEDHVVGKKLRKTGTYGADERARLTPHITINSRVLVVGAHVGSLAIPLSRLCREVVAVEANPATFDLLTTNIALNAVSNCRAVNVAASDKAEDIAFLQNRVNSGGSKRVPKIKEFMYYFDNPATIAVRGVSLDRALEDTGFQVVVMDIEGSEYFALQGMPGILSRCSLLVVEFLPHHLKNVSGVTVEQFVSVIAPHFSRMTIPSKGLSVGRSEFVQRLQEMYDRDEGDEGIMFEKT
jgi:FkbM family methyltransferase